MNRLLPVILSLICCLVAVDAQGRTSVTKIIKKPKLSKVKVEVPVTKVPKIQPAPHRAFGNGGIIRRNNIAKLKPYAHFAALRPLKPKPTYFFLIGLTQKQQDSITDANNRSNRFLTHGIATRQAYRTLCDSIDSLSSRCDSLFQGVESLSADEFVKIQTADPELARYIEDSIGGFPEQTLMWTNLLSQVYPHVSNKVLPIGLYDFEEVAAKRREYFNPDELPFLQIYRKIISRIISLNGKPDFD